jgi:asparagine synthase (glutamine-hydrolysing)
MCGIAGGVSEFYNHELQDVVQAMSKRIAHRGRDDDGMWIISNSLYTVSLAHRRLSIVDLSRNGAQPMCSANGLLNIIFNGEIYNHKELRDEINQMGCNILWRGSSDTETLLNAFEIWGVPRALAKCVGMFAFALWDERRKVLTIARDRLGEKPLYYGLFNGSFYFASELSAFKAVPGFNGKLNKQALALYFQKNYVPGPFSIFEDVFKLIPGTYLEVSVGGHKNIKSLIPQAYWSLENSCNERSIDATFLSDKEGLARLDEMLKKSISLQRIADVPIGAFLSGGIDSSLVSALLQICSSAKINTFTMGFEHVEFNEAPYARKISKYIGSNHNEIYVESKDVLKCVQGIANIYDEPFADSSQIPTFLLCQFAGRHVKVCLSGDGGDELFGGYPRYLRVNELWGRLNNIPYKGRHALSTLLSNSVLKIGLEKQSVLRKISCLNSKTLVDFYENYTSQFVLSELFVSANPRKLQKRTLHRISGTLNDLLIADVLGYLPDDILVKTDRASMNVGLELRTPFLDYRIVDFIQQLPMRFKIRDGKGKWMLRELAYKYINKELLERPKMGFGVPMAEWLRGELREWARCLINDFDSEYGDEMINMTLVKKMLNIHLNRIEDLSSQLWSILAFISWLKNYNSRI